MRQSQSLSSLLADSVKPVHELLAPPPADDEAPLDTAEEIPASPDDLWGEPESPQPTETPINLESKREELYQWVADKKGWKTTKPVRSWLVNACRIPEDKIDTGPEGVLQEVKTLQGWND